MGSDEATATSDSCLLEREPVFPPAEAYIAGRDAPRPLCGRRLVPPRTSMAAMADAVEGRWSPVGDLVQSKMLSAFPNVQGFLQGTIVYIVSQEVQDLLSIFVLELHPAPYCGRDGLAPCAADAPSWQQALYAFSLIGVLTPLQLISVRYEQHFPSLSIFPSVSRMIAGWALGNVFQKMVVEHDGAAGCGSCHLTHITCSTALTLFCAAMTLLIQPLTLARCLGRGLTEEVLRTVWEKVLKALSFAQMMVWTDTLNALLVSGATTHERVGVLYPRLLALWAFSLTSFFSVLTMHLVRWRQYLTDTAPGGDVGDADHEASAPWARRRLHKRASEMQDSGLTFRSTLLQSLALAEGTLGWSSGVSWTNAIVSAPFMPPLWHIPTVAACVQHGVTAAALTVLAVWWFVASSSPLSIDEQEKSQRDKVELFYFTNGISFFVGFTWTLFIRALRVRLRLAVRFAPGWDLWGEVLVVCLSAPVLIVAILRAKDLSLNAYAKSSGIEAHEKLRALLLRAVVADGSELDLQHRRLKRAISIMPPLRAAHQCWYP